MNYTIDKLNRTVTVQSKTKNIIVINEFDKLDKRFIDGTQDKYDCELILLEVEIYDEKMNIIGNETKAFARRIGFSEWIMDFDTEDYKKQI